MGDLYTRLVSGLIFPIHERLKHHSTVAVRRQLEDSQWWPADHLAAQLARQGRRGIRSTEQTRWRDKSASEPASGIHSMLQLVDRLLHGAGEIVGRRRALRQHREAFAERQVFLLQPGDFALQLVDDGDHGFLRYFLAVDLDPFTEFNQMRR